VLRSRDAPTRLALAAATAAAFAFAFSAAIDWIWFMPVLPFALFVCAAVIFSPERSEEDDVHPAPPARRSRTPLGIALSAIAALVCLAAIVVIALPMASTEQVRTSQAEVRDGDLTAALSHAKEAVTLEPYAAAGWLQEALVQEDAGNLTLALADARQALKRQAVNWEIWAQVAQIEAVSGNAPAALAADRQAFRLNPNQFPGV
jgi:tetratricopeptide (TPR) repeat protein